MRTIKFRGKREDNGEWVYGSGYVKDYFNDNEFIAIVGDPIFQHMDMIRVIYKTVGQFTGLVDKNGKEIYEGDILGGEGALIASVQFKYGSFVKRHWNQTLNMGSTELYNIVIGNIHDNADLLE